MELSDSIVSMPDFSIIIPVFNEEASIAMCVGAAQETFDDTDYELIIVDAKSTDQTASIVRSIPDERVRYVKAPSAGRARQMNHGAQHSSGKVLVFLHADTKVEAGLADELLEFSTSDLAWGFCGVKYCDTGRQYRLLAFMINGRSRLSHISTGDQTQFVKANVFSSIGGFPDQRLMEDVELSRRLKKHSRAFVCETQNYSSERKWREQGFWSTVVLMWRLRLQYFFGAHPEKLFREYYKQ